jgi:uncharacterized protein DUF5050
MLRARVIGGPRGARCALTLFGSLAALLVAACGSGDSDPGGAAAGAAGSGSGGDSGSGGTGVGGSAGTSANNPYPGYQGAADSYFLTECIASCAQGLSCVAGVCSQACDSGDATCGAIAPGAVCLEQTTADGAVGACDVPCAEVSDCRGASYCDLTVGRCRAPGLAGGGVDTLELVNGVRILVEGEYSPRDVLVDDKYLYWTNSSAAIRRAALAGGEATTLTIGHSLGTVVASGDYVYFSDYLVGDDTGTVARIPRDGGEPTVLATGVVPSSIALDGDRIYWVDQGSSLSDGRIYSALLDGSDPKTIAEGLNAPFGLTVAGGFVYYANAVQNCPAGSQASNCIGGVSRLPLAGGSPEQLDTTNSASNLVATEAGVYWLGDSPRALLFAPLAGETQTLANISVEGTGDLTLDADALYWSSSDKLLRFPFTSTAVERLLANRNLSRSAAVMGDSVLVAESELGRILAVAKDGSGNRPKAAIAGPCPTVVGEASEMALSPRADENLEALALSLEPQRLTAAQATYDRVVADMAAIRALAPELAAVGFTPPYQSSLSLVLSDVAERSIKDGQYSAWSCLNDFYGPMAMTMLEGTTYPRVEVLEFERVFNVEILSELYRQLPGIEDGDPNYNVSQASQLAARRDGERFEYFILTSAPQCGDVCPSPIDDPSARHFESTSAGSVSEL